MKKTALAVLIFLLVSVTVSFAGFYSDFSIIDYSAYSNLLGDQYAKITVHNSAGGGRFIDSNAFSARCADGATLAGRGGTSIRLDAGQTATIMVSFGRHNFPIETITIK